MGQTLQHQPRRFFFRHLTTQNGLSYNLIISLFQDREGYIWVGTFNGLNRYDGSRFVTFKHDRNNPKTIAHNTVTDICEDQAGNIWLGTSSGISRYNKATNTFDNYQLERRSADAFRHNDITGIICDRQGTIWATTVAGLYEFQAKSNTFKAYHHDPANPATLSSETIGRNSLVEDLTLPRIWIATSKGVNCFDTQKKIAYNYRHNPEHIPILNDHFTLPLARDQKGQIVFSDYGLKQLVTYNPQTKTASYSTAVVQDGSLKPFTEISSIFFDSRNNLWASTWQYRVFFKDAATGQQQRILHEPANPSSINSDFFWDIMQARDGTIYVGGLYGLSVYYPGNNFFTVHDLTDQFPALKGHLNLRSLFQDASGKLWIGESGHGLFSYDFTTNHYEHFTIPSPATEQEIANGVNNISYINGELWLSTSKGVQIFNPATRRFRRFLATSSARPLNKAWVSWCFQDRQRAIWFSADAKWLFRYDPAKQTFQEFNLDSLFIHPTRKTYATAIGEDYLGNVWIATAAGRLHQYKSQTGTFKSFAPTPTPIRGVIQAPANDLLVDAKGLVWLATEGGGLVRFDPATERFTSWMESDGLLMDVCRSLITDQFGRIWVGSYEGFTLFDPKSEKIQNPRLDYGQQDNNFFSRGKCRLTDGRLAFINGESFVVMNTAQITTKKQAPTPIITNITVFEKAKPLYRSIENVRLSYQENFFTLDFSTLRAPQETAVEYAYRLKKYDPDWVLSGSRTFAPYTGVTGGNYQFEVKARFKDGEWSQPVLLPVYITPPFWQLLWFQLLAVGALAGLIAYVAKRRERRLLHEQREKSEIRERLAASEMKALRAQMNPHFLYNSLNAIRLFVLQNDSDNAEKFLVKFARLVRLILNNSRQEWVNLGSEVEQLQLYMELEQLRFDNKFNFSLKVDPTLNRDTTLIPSMITQPFIENSILHGIAHKRSNGNIDICIQRIDNYLECSVDDDGVGRQRAQALKSKTVTQHQSVGLKVTQERLQLIGQRNGQVTGVFVIDKQDEHGQPTGTKVIIRLPLITQ